MLSLTFTDPNRQIWIRKITEFRKKFCNKTNTKHSFDLILKKKIGLPDINPMHIVLLACLVEYIERLGYTVWLTAENDDLYIFLKDELQFDRYFKKDI